MRRVETSLGLELGPPEGPWVDLFAFRDPGRHLPPEPVAVDLKAAAGALRARAGEWTPWRGSPFARMSPFRGAGLSGIVGTVTVGEEGGEWGLVLAFRFPEGMEPARALRLVEDYEAAQGVVIPAEIAAAALSAARSRVYPLRLAPGVFADAAGDMAPAEAGPLSARDLEGLVRPYLKALLKGEAFRGPASPTDRARLILMAAEALWRPETVKFLHGLGPALKPTDAGVLAFLAFAWDEMRPREELPLPTGVRLAVGLKGPDRVGLWPIWADLVRYGFGPEECAFFGAGRTLKVGPEAASEPSAPAAGADPDLLKGLKAELIKQAALSARYVPRGGFVVRPPKALGLGEIRVFADEGGLWAVVKGLEETPLRWTPDRFDHGFAPLAGSLLDLVLSALWHDLRVGGPPAFGEERPERGPWTTGAGGRGPHVRTLPAPVREWPGGGRERAWGTEAEERAARRAHMVRGHLRALWPDQRASERAREEAKRYGLVLPQGYTFVRPHVRGGKKAEGPAPPPVEVRARGLVSLAAFAGLGRDKS